LRIAESEARKSHAGIWRYGDVGDVGDDDEEEY
jgi:endonuclease YncB( thermonuclease family)